MTEIYKGATSQSIFIELVDSSTGLPKTGVAYTAVTASYARTRGIRTAISVVTLISPSSPWTSGGFSEVDTTNQPGIYRFDPPDLAFATGASEVVITLKATGCRSQCRSFVLTDWNKQVAAIPNVAAGASGGLPTGNASGHVTPADGSITATKIADNALTAAKFASGAFDAVWTVTTRTLSSFGTLVADIWSHTTRILTAGTNIVLAKGTGITGFNDLSAAQVNAEADTALADVGLTSAVVGEIHADTGSAATNAQTAAANTATLLARISATLFSGITSAAAWLRALGRKSAADVTAISEINTGGGTFDPTADSLEAQADAAAAAAGLTASQEEKLDAVKAKTDLIGSLAYTIVNPVDTSDGDRLSLVAGDDYTGTGRVPTWTVTGWTGPTLAAAGKLRLVRLPRYVQGKLSRVSADLELDATIAADGSTLTITAPITGAETSTLTGLTDTADVDTHRYQLLGFDASAPTELVSIMLGMATVLRGVSEEA